MTTQSLKDLTSRLKENYLTTSVSDRRTEMLQQANMLDERESFSGLRKQRFQNAYSFSIRTTFNQPGHLATVIAFDLPINDIIPLNMARSNFLLLPDNEEIDDSMVPSETAINAQAALKGSWVEFSVSLPNSPLQLIYRVSAFNLAIDLLRNNIWLLAVESAVTDAIDGGHLFPSPAIHPPQRKYRRRAGSPTLTQPGNCRQPALRATGL